MKNPAAETLFNLIAEEPELIKGAETVLFIRPTLHPRLEVLKSAGLACLQTFKPEAEKLAVQGYKTVTEAQGENLYDLVVLLPGQQRDENLHNFARAVKYLKDGGMVLCSLSNDLGAKRFEKHLEELLGGIDTYSRNKCRVFWGRKTPAVAPDLLKTWLELGGLSRIEGTDILSCPGVFSRSKIDVGSKILCEALPRELQGRGADLGAGYGFISHYLTKNIAGITAIHLYEAEKLALDAARANVEGHGKDIDISYHWHDVTTGLSHRNLDWIVMNPPFHQGKAPATSLGQRFIQAAGKALRPGGRLYLVANQNLPYLPLLIQSFESSQIVTEAEGYRVMAAQK